jgi:hypothetical protein
MADIELVVKKITVFTAQPEPLNKVSVTVTGSRGDRGIPGEGAAEVYPFSWGDIPNSVQSIALAGKIIFKVEVLVQTPFDVLSFLSLGDTANHERLVAQNQVDLTEEGAYQTNPDYTYPVDTEVNLYLTVGDGVSSGNGLILIYSSE